MWVSLLMTDYICPANEVCQELPLHQLTFKTK